jgi:paraquat-inducible protein A
MLRAVSLIVLLTSLVLLYFGITESMINIDLSYFIDAKIKSFEGNIFNTSRSILQTSQHLIDTDKVFVGIMILTFSCFIPLIKTLMILSLHSKKLSNQKVKKILNAISKWSMADVFVVAIFLVFLATDGVSQLQQEQFSMLGMSLDVKFKVIMTSQFENGFYYFLSYCLISIAHTQFMKKIAY